MQVLLDTVVAMRKCCYTHGMDRPSFTLRTLLIVVAVCAMGVQAYLMRPGQMSPLDIRIGMTKEQLRWSCATLPNDDWSRTWTYTVLVNGTPTLVWVVFDPNGTVSYSGTNAPFCTGG